jgi:zinc/manganese transport system substrate-binding protein
MASRRSNLSRAAALAAVLATLLAAALTAAGCGPNAPAAGTVPVVAAENFYGSIVSQLGGPHVTVTSIITNPSADPHQYTSSTQDSFAVASAKLVVINGAGYDSFMSKLLSATHGSGRSVLYVDKLVGTTGSDPNPHLWYDPPTPVKVAQAVTAALVRDDPGHAADYRHRLDVFLASLRPIDAEIASLHRRFAGTPFAYSERVPGYLTARIGLKLLTPPAFAHANEAGTDPPPQSVAAMRALVTGHRIRVLLYNAQASSQVGASIRALARSDRIPVVGVSETSPAGVSYQQWQLDQLRAIDAALSRG